MLQEFSGGVRQKGKKGGGKVWLDGFVGTCERGGLSERGKEERKKGARKRG